MRSPIIWFGGKGMMVAKLLPILSEYPHRRYIEVFGGGASLLFAKDPVPIEVYNDLDSGLVNFFRVLRDPDLFARFYHKVLLTPYSREEYYYCRETWEEQDDPVERAYRWFVVNRQGFSGGFGGSWSFSVSTVKLGMLSTCSKWMSILCVLPIVHERFMRVQIEHDDFRNILYNYDSSETLFYVDPPYLPDTRKSGGYNCEMSEEDHRDLVGKLLDLEGHAVLSGYPNRVYQPLIEAGWDYQEWETVCHAAGKTRGTGILGEGASFNSVPRTEAVWCSPNPDIPKLDFGE